MSVFGERLEKKLAKEALDFLVLDDVEWDSKIVEEDVVGSEAHVIMLQERGIISENELEEILKALEKVKTLNREGRFKLDPELEDVHLNIENFVIKEAGMDVGGKLHTGRSRNDQIILDLRLYLRKEINGIISLLLKLIQTFLNLTEKHLHTIMPAYTHLQHAQPTTLAHWFTAYVSMFLRDAERLENVYNYINKNPLGACALVGTSWPIDREKTALLLGFNGVQDNSLDVITSRGEDLAEFLSALSILMVHLSRLSEDLMLWTTYEFGIIKLDDAYSMGSSIMPQKKNPDVAELTRGKASMVISQLMLTLSLMKGLPSGYFKDLQETKPAVFKTTETIKRTLKVIHGMVSTMRAEKQRMYELASANFSTATDLADLLARKTGVPFRVAHQIVGKMVRNAIEENKRPSDLGLEDLNKACLNVISREISLTDKEVKEALDPLKSIQSKKSLGSPNPNEVLRMVRRNREKTREKFKALSKRVRKLEKAQKRLQSIITEAIKSTV